MKIHVINSRQLNTPDFFRKAPGNYPMSSRRFHPLACRVSKALFANVDREARRRGVSRSALIKLAINRLLADVGAGPATVDGVPLAQSRGRFPDGQPTALAARLLPSATMRSGFTERPR